MKQFVPIGTDGFEPPLSYPCRCSVPHIFVRLPNALSDKYLPLMTFVTRASAPQFLTPFCLSYIPAPSTRSSTNLVLRLIYEFLRRFLISPPMTSLWLIPTTLFGRLLRLGFEPNYCLLPPSAVKLQ